MPAFIQVTSKVITDASDGNHLVLKGSVQRLFPNAIAQYISDIRSLKSITYIPMNEVRGCYRRTGFEDLAEYIDLTQDYVENQIETLSAALQISVRFPEIDHKIKGCIKSYTCRPVGYAQNLEYTKCNWRSQPYTYDINQRRVTIDGGRMCEGLLRHGSDTRDSTREVIRAFLQHHEHGAASDGWA